jgi:VanZ family protein
MVKNMKKLPLPVIELDKANHFIYGSVIYALSLLIFPIIPSLLIVALIAALKEWHDHYVPGANADIMDFIWTMAGCLPILLTQLTN